MGRIQTEKCIDFGSVCHGQADMLLIAAGGSGNQPGKGQALARQFGLGEHAAVKGIFREEETAFSGAEKGSVQQGNHGYRRA